MKVEVKEERKRWKTKSKRDETGWPDGRHAAAADTVITLRVRGGPVQSGLEYASSPWSQPESRTAGQPGLSWEWECAFQRSQDKHVGCLVIIVAVVGS